MTDVGKERGGKSEDKGMSGRHGEMAAAVCRNVNHDSD